MAGRKRAPSPRLAAPPESMRTLFSEAEREEILEEVRASDVQTSERLDVTNTSVLVTRKGRLTKRGRVGIRELRRMTLYVDPALFERLQARAILERRTLSGLAEEAFSRLLEVS